MIYYILYICRKREKEFTRQKYWVSVETLFSNFSLYSFLSMRWGVHLPTYILYSTCCCCCYNDLKEGILAAQLIRNNYVSQT